MQTMCLEPSPQLYKQVKKALANFHDLAYLGESSLAHSLLPEGIFSVWTKGELLQQLLYEALEQLKPSGVPPKNEAPWRPYRILYATYVKRHSRQRIIDSLCLSQSTFYRSQKQALVALSEHVKEKFRMLNAFSVRPRPIPRVQPFIGRSEELARYEQQLEMNHVAVITGLPGVGKTSLGAELAAKQQAHGKPVIWVTFQEHDTDLGTFLKTMALSLAALGQDAYWRFLQVQQRQAPPTSLQGAQHYLLTLLEEGGYLLCLDDWQWAQDSQALTTLCTDLLHSARAGKIQLLVMSRVVPSFVQDDFLLPLEGLSARQTRELLQSTNIHLPTELFDRLYDSTAGIPVLLKLFAAWIQSQGGNDQDKTKTFINDIAKQQAVRGYLLRQVYETLSVQERRFVTCASVFRIPMDIQDPAIVALLEAKGIINVEKTWIALADRHVLSCTVEQQISLHAVLREYFLCQLRLKEEEWQRIHHQVGRYYEQHKGDVIEASHHFIRAGAYRRATRLIAKSVKSLTNNGLAQPALRHLEQLTSYLQHEPLEIRFAALKARESLSSVSSQTQQTLVLDTLEQWAAQLNDPVEQADVALRRARHAAATGDYATSITAAQQAIAWSASAVDVEAQANLRWGQALKGLANYTAASARIEHALELAQLAHSPYVQAACLHGLSSIALAQGDYVQAERSLQQALELCHQIGEKRGQGTVLLDLGTAAFYQNDFEQARTYYERALRIHRAIEHKFGEVLDLNNLGMVATCVFDYVQAQTHLEQSLHINQQLNNKRGISIVLSNLADNALALGDHDQAQDYCQQALQIKRDICDRWGQSVTLTCLGLVYCQQGYYDMALSHTQQALEIACEIGARSNQAYALNVLGYMQLRQGQLPQAVQAYQRAVSLFQELGQRNQAIENQAGLALALSRQGQTVQAQKLVQEVVAHLESSAVPIKPGKGIEGVVQPLQVYLSCYYVWQAAQDPRAKDILDLAFAWLQDLAAKVKDETARNQFLENVPAHREMVALKE